MFGLSLHILLPNSTLLCWYNLLVVRSPQVVVAQHRVRKDFAHEVHLFGWCLQIALLFPVFNFVPSASWEFQVCPAEAFNPYSSTFRRIGFIGSEFWDTQPWIFVLIQNSNWSLSTFFPTSRWVSSYRQHVEIGNDSHECICFQTCNHDTRDDVDNLTTIFYILPAVDKEFSALVTGLAFRLFELFPPVCVFTFGTEEYACSWCEFLASLHFIPRCLHGLPRHAGAEKLQASLLEQDPIVFPLPTFFSVPLGVRVFRPFVLSRLHAR